MVSQTRTHQVFIQVSLWSVEEPHNGILPGYKMLQHGWILKILNERTSHEKPHSVWTDLCEISKREMHHVIHWWFLGLVKDGGSLGDGEWVCSLEWCLCYSKYMKSHLEPSIGHIVPCLHTISCFYWIPSKNTKVIFRKVKYYVRRFVCLEHHFSFLFFFFNLCAFQKVFLLCSTGFDISLWWFEIVAIK